MTTVTVTLTPGVDTDQSASLNSQIAAAPDGTLGNETIVQLPTGRYRINDPPSLANRHHLRIVVPGAVPLVVNALTGAPRPADSAGFWAYTDLASFVNQAHWNWSGCTNCYGSNVYVDGPHLGRTGIYSQYTAAKESCHAYAVTGASTDCGWTDGWYINVFGDGMYVGQAGDTLLGDPTNVNSSFARISGTYAGRHCQTIVSGDGVTFTDCWGDLAGFDGFDIECNGNVQRAWNVTCTRVTVGAKLIPWAFNYSTNTFFVLPVRKFADFTLTDCRTLHGSGLALMADGGTGTLTVDGLIDLRNNQFVGITITAWDNATFKNCNVRLEDGGGHTVVPSFAIRSFVTGTLRITNNTFNGDPVKNGFQNLVDLRTTPADYVHYGNEWKGTGLLHDDPFPISNFAAAPAKLSGSGTATTLAVGHIEGAPASFAGVGSVDDTAVDEFVVLSTIGGAPFRLRSSRVASRFRTGAAVRIRGQQGAAVRQAFRLRAAMGSGRLRSYQFPSSLRSGEPGVPVTGTGGFAAAPAAFAGSGSVADVFGTGAFAAAPAVLAGTATEMITGTGGFIAAAASFAGTGAQSNAAFGDLHAAPASFAGEGVVDAVGIGSFLGAPASFGGLSTTGVTGTGDFAAAAASFAGAGFATEPAYFTPPIEPFLRVPSVARLEWVASEYNTTGVPRSPRYRQFLGTQVGTDVTIGGVFYGGGRWHGPLTSEQISAIEEAGYGDRIVRASDPALLPAGID